VIGEYEDDVFFLEAFEKEEASICVRVMCVCMCVCMQAQTFLFF